MVAVRVLNYGITLSCLIGLGLSIYAFYVEAEAERDEGYEAMCDISEHMSCSKVFRSQYGRGFGFMGKLFGEDSVFNKPNSLTGVLAYSLLATLAQSNTKPITFISLVVIILSNLASVYFAYILYFILYDFCVVCVSTYVVNFINLALTYWKFKKLLKDGKKKRH